jgi:hypothetical protein
VPTTDIGFDPKCIVKRTPVMVGEVARVSTWQFDVDIDYIKSIGGVAKCFNPMMRSGTPDVGAYRAGPVTTVMPGSCVPPPIPDPPTGGMGGMAGASGSGGIAGADQAGAGGLLGGMGGAAVAGAMNGGGSAGASAGGAGGAGGAVGPLGGAPAGGTSSSGTPGAGGSGVPTAGTVGGPSSSGAPSGESTPKETAGCGCRVPRRLESSRVITALALLMFGALAIRRRTS